MSLWKFFAPRATVIYCPTLPEYLRLNDGSDPEWIVKYKRRPWSRWSVLSDGFSVPRPFPKIRAEEIAAYITDGKMAPWIL